MSEADCRVLVVDDDPAVLDMLGDLLTFWGYQALRETSGEAALIDVAAHPPRAALVDLVLPGMDGVTLIESLAPHVPPAATILLTGYERHPRVDAARRLGVRAVLRKPASFDEVRGALRAVCG